MKQTFASKFYASKTYASGHWAGLGVDIADTRGWVVMRSFLPQDVSPSDSLVTKLHLKSQTVTSIGGTDG